jgi:non-ribosomal peptide synthetase component F
VDFLRPAVFSFEGSRFGFNLGGEIFRGIKELSRETGATRYMILLAMLNILFHKYTGQEDIVIGSQVMGRPHADLRKVIGMFVNSLAMRNFPVGYKTCRDFILEVMESSISAFENQELAFEELVEKLNPTRDTSRNPLFDISFVLQNFERASRGLKSMAVTPVSMENKISKFDLTLFGYEDDGAEEIYIVMEYCTSLFKEETVRRMSKHILKVLEQAVRTPGMFIREVDPVTDEERKQLLYDFNDTWTDYPRDKTIHELFEALVEINPDRMAVVFSSTSNPGIQITYRELDRRSNLLAIELKEN